MSENRYRSVGKCETELFNPGCPVQITGYEIFYDTQYDRAVARVSIRNITSKTVKSVYVNADCFDDANDPLGSTGDFAISDLMLEGGQSVSPETDVILTSRNVSTVKMSITKLVFTDGEVFRNENTETVALTEQTFADSKYPN